MIHSPLIKALPEPLRQRDQLGLIASIGFHGALFLGLALLPATSPAVNTGRVVGLVDLSPAERNRLPNTAPAPAFPPINPPPSVSTLPGLDLPPLSEIPDLSLLPPLPPLESFDLESLPPPVFIPRQSLPPTQPLDLPPPQIPAFPPRPLPPPTAPAAPPTPDFQLGTQLPQLKPGVFPPSNPVITLNPPPPSPTPTPTPEPTNPAVVAAVNQLGSWINNARASYPNLELKRIVIPHPYPAQACPDKLEGFAQVGVIVDAKGQLVAAQPSLDLNLKPSPVKPPAQAEQTNPQFLQSTGLPILDAAAIAAVKAQTFPASGNPQLLLIGFDFKYSEAVCSGTAPPAASPAPPNPDSPTPAAPPASPPAPLNLELSPPGTEETPPPPASPSPQAPEASPPPAPDASQTPQPQPVPEGSQDSQPQPTPGSEEPNPPPPTPDFDLDLTPVPDAN